MMENWKLQDGDPAPYPVKDSDLALKREVFETAKTVGKWYLIVTIPFAILGLGLILTIWVGMAHQVSAYNRQSAQIRAEHPALPIANWTPSGQPAVQHPTQQEVNLANREAAAILNRTQKEYDRDHRKDVAAQKELDREIHEIDARIQGRRKL